MKYNDHATKNLEEGKHSKFYVASYLLDAIFGKCDFEGLGLKWSPEDELAMNIYFKWLWNTKYKGMYENIVEYFISPLYH